MLQIIRWIYLYLCLVGSALNEDRLVSRVHMDLMVQQDNDEEGLALKDYELILWLDEEFLSHQGLE